MQSLNNYIFCFFALPTIILEILGILVYRWKGIENTFPPVYYMPQKS